MEELTHHPFETLDGVVTLLVEKGALMPRPLHALARKLVAGAVGVAEKRIGNVPSGFQENMASGALKRSKEKLGAVS
jgi:hypothetical protein